MWTFAGISADKYTLINHGYLEQVNIYIKY